VSLEVTIPVGSEAKVGVPNMGLQDVTVEEGGKAVWRNGSYVPGAAGITGGSETAEYVTFDTCSGTYGFILRASSR